MRDLKTHQPKQKMSKDAKRALNAWVRATNKQLAQGDYVTLKGF